MTAVFKFQDVLLINNVLMDCFGKDRLFVWKDTTGRRWAIIKGVLWSMPPNYKESKKPICWGELGSFEWYGHSFDPKRKHDYRWQFDTEGLTHQITVFPPFDCRSCTHLVYIDEDECGTEGGGIACEVNWENGDTYLCSSDYETRGCICKHYKPRKDVKQCPRCGNLLHLFNGKPIDCYECKRGVFE